MISGMEGVISVFHSDPDTIKPHTTRSWDFVSLLEGTSLINAGEELPQNGNYGEDIIVGVIDTGVWPESSSFNDKGMGPVPKSWNGTCQEGYEAHYGPLNKTRDFRSPRDVNGHGTHVAATVGGRRVANASAIGGFAMGTATGGAPNVRLAIYKVCWPVPNKTLAQGTACFSDDILAAFDDAIANGVHVLSISLGSLPIKTYYKQNSIAIGSLNAVKRNIVVACSAGNSGPTPSTVGNVAPWIITVGASSIDRVFSSPIMLGNGIIVEGETVTPIMRRKLHPLVYAGDVEITGTTTSKTTG
uniref:Xylem serine proteinase 1 n=1 Tax=Solanum tuberosum TaxID=4113 RepID=M1BNH3_SOLTU